MTAPAPVQAFPSPGTVTVVVDPATALQLAVAWEFAHSLGALDDEKRPTYLLDAAELRRAAGAAEGQAPADLVPVRVLRLVGGDR